MRLFCRRFPRAAVCVPSPFDPCRPPPCCQALEHQHNRACACVHHRVRACGGHTRMHAHVRAFTPPRAHTDCALGFPSLFAASPSRRAASASALLFGRAWSPAGARPSSVRGDACSAPGGVRGTPGSGRGCPDCPPPSARPPGRRANIHSPPCTGGPCSRRRAPTPSTSRRRIGGCSPPRPPGGPASGRRRHGRAAPPLGAAAKAAAYAASGGAHTSAQTPCIAAELRCVSVTCITASASVVATRQRRTPRIATACRVDRTARVGHKEATEAELEEPSRVEAAVQHTSAAGPVGEQAETRCRQRGSRTTREVTEPGRGQREGGPGRHAEGGAERTWIQVS